MSDPSQPSVNESVASNEALVNCHFCMSPIPALAKKCRHCGETLDHTMRELENLRRNQGSQQPMVFMNAGGGGGGGGSSSAAAAAAVGGNGQLLGTKSRFVAALLAFFLGGIGIHKFYLGQTGWGIIYLLFCWTFIPMLIAPIEGILYLLSTERAFALKYG